jgi:hypothetical protein
MSDSNTGKTVTANEVSFKKVECVRTIPDVTVVYADTVINQIMGPGISKFTFCRIDSIAGVIDEYEKVEVAQIIMPSINFADMVAFFEHRLKVMIKNGYLDQAIIDERRKFYSEYPV